MKTFKTNIMNRVKALSLLALVAALAFGFTSCNDDKYDGDPYFNVEGLTDGAIVLENVAIDTTSYSAAKKFVIRSNRPWKLVAQGENGWVRVFPSEGEGDGIIRVSSLENVKPVNRELKFKVLLDGEDCGQTVTIMQKLSEPYMRASSNMVQVAREGGDVLIPIVTNVPFTFEIQGENSDWVTATLDSEGVIKLNCLYNTPGAERNATLHVQGEGDFSNLQLNIPITQLGEVLLYENFSWLVKSEAGVDYPLVGWEYDKCLRIDAWSADEKSHGWESRSGLMSKKVPAAYSMKGFVKVGRANFGGEVLSPALSKIEGTRNIKVSFQAVAYAAATGAVDDKELYVGVIGGGKVVGITGGDETKNSVESSYSYCDENGNPIELVGVAHATLHADNQFNQNIDPTGLKIWDEPFTHYTVLIEGATSQTRIALFGGLFDTALKGVGVGKNRLFFDNVKVEYR